MRGISVRHPDRSEERAEEDSQLANRRRRDIWLADDALPNGGDLMARSARPGALAGASAGK